jgi:hypothetical protein
MATVHDIAQARIESTWIHEGIFRFERAARYGDRAFASGMEAMLECRRRSTALVGLAWWHRDTAKVEAAACWLLQGLGVAEHNLRWLGAPVDAGAAISTVGGVDSVAARPFGFAEAAVTCPQTIARVRGAVDAVRRLRERLRKTGQSLPDLFEELQVQAQRLEFALVANWAGLGGITHSVDQGQIIQVDLLERPILVCMSYDTSNTTVTITPLDGDYLRGRVPSQMNMIVLRDGVESDLGAHSAAQVAGRMAAWSRLANG